MTIYALSSGPGLSGIAVIRISGSNSEKSIEKYDIFANSEAQNCNFKKI